MEQEGGKEKQVRLDDVFTAILSKMIDMPQQTIE